MAAAGSIVQHYAYSSFGKLLKISDANGNDVTAAPPVKTHYGFTGREHDSESGMMYYRARYYMPEIGRFIQEDPFKGKHLDPLTVINAFIYVLNNPLYNTDPSGKIAFPPDTHGNYCGNGQNKAPIDEEFRYRSYDKYGNGIGEPLKPTDSLDEACYSHDRAYSGGDLEGLGAWLEFGNSNTTRRQLDTDLTLTKRGIDYTLTSLARLDIGGTIEGVIHVGGGALFASWSLIRLGVSIPIQIIRFGIKL